jgi:hypothetical protein
VANSPPRPEPLRREVSVSTRPSVRVILSAMRWRGRRSVGLLVAGFAFGGCSVALVDRAPARDQWPAEHRFGQELTRCTTSPIDPIVDGAIGLALGGGAIYFAGRGDDAAPFVATAVAVPALVFLASALYGVGATKTCRTYLAGPAYGPAGR